MKNLTKYYLVWVAIGLALSLTITVRAQYRVLHHFTGPTNDGSGPWGSLIQSGSTLYGMTSTGGSDNTGVIFNINTDGTSFHVMHNFISAGDDGTGPFGTLLLDGSILYGMATSQGTAYGGTLFKIDTDGTDFGVLKNFGVSDGEWPYDALIQADSILYGMNTYGGSVSGWGGKGTIFRVNTDGSGFQVLHTFNGGTNDGYGPHGSLLQIGSTLYGMTAIGGSQNNGTIFKINSDGTGFQLLHSFAGGSNDGKWPHVSTLVQSGSTFYGMTSFGGTRDKGAIFRINIDGTGFQLLHSFSGGTDGFKPFGSLILSGSNIYGMTSDEGSSTSGTIFQIDTTGMGFHVLHRFTGSDGKDPGGSLLLSDSVLYGMTSAGGSDSLGVIFAFDLRGTTSVHEEKSKGAIKNFRLEQNYPNPFNPNTVISYQLSVNSNVKLSIFNVLGQKIKTLVNSFQNAGEHSLVWNATNEKNKPVSSGVYFYSLQTNKMTLQNKMILLR
jgi:uncharacterized repeat protein (TIGR03803 family)